MCRQWHFVGWSVGRTSAVGACIMRFSSSSSSLPTRTGIFFGWEERKMRGGGLRILYNNYKPISRRPVCMGQCSTKNRVEKQLTNTPPPSSSRIPFSLTFFEGFCVGGRVSREKKPLLFSSRGRNISDLITQTGRATSV